MISSHTSSLTKTAYAVLVVTLFGIFSACKQQQQVTTKETTPQQKGISEYDQIKFASLYVDGCKERMKGNIDIAQVIFKECLKLDPNSAAVKYELAGISRYNGQNDVALKYAKECSIADSKNEWYQLLYIDCLHQKKQFLQACTVYEKLIKQSPDKAEFYESLAIEYSYASEYDKSLKTYETFEKRFGKSEPLTLNKIKLLKQLKRAAEVESELKELIATNPKETRFYTYLAEFYQENNQYEKAMGIYKDLLIIDPKNPSVHLALADYYKQKGEKEKFYEEIKTAFDSPDLDVDTKTKILVSYYTLTEQYPEYTSQAYSLCESMLKLHPTSAEAHSIYADFLFRDKKLKEARDEYATASTYDKSRFPIWKQLLYLDSELNDYKALEAHSTEALELFPNQSVVYFFNGVANLQLKNYKKSAAILNDGLEFVYNNIPLQTQFYANIGEAYNALKDYEKADKAFEDALKDDPDNVYILNNYSYYLSLRKQHLEKAEKLSKRSNELSPNNRSYMDTYGWILYQMEKYKEAEEWLSKAAKMGTKNPVILEHYGDVLYKLTKLDAALEAWQDAKNAGSTSELLIKKISDKKLYE